MGTFNDLNQLWVMDYGLPGPAKAAGGKHVVLPPGWDGEVPAGMYVGRSTTNRVLGLIRAMPIGGDMDAADRLMQSVKVYPLEPREDWPETTWVDLSVIDGADFTPVRWETGLDYWRVLHETLQAEPPNPAYRYEYGELAQLGIVRGRAFAPDARQTGILEKASAIGHAHLLAQSFADRSPSKEVWPGRHWEWAVLQSENGTTKPGIGWFVYFRIYGPGPAAFDGTWQLPDFTRA